MEVKESREQIQESRELTKFYKNPWKYSLKNFYVLVIKYRVWALVYLAKFNPYINAHLQIWVYKVTVGGSINYKM